MQKRQENRHTESVNTLLFTYIKKRHENRHYESDKISAFRIKRHEKRPIESYVKTLLLAYSKKSVTEIDKISAFTKNVTKI